MLPRKQDYGSMKFVCPATRRERTLRGFEDVCAKKPHRACKTCSGPQKVEKQDQRANGDNWLKQNSNNLAKCERLGLTMDRKAMIENHCNAYPNCNKCKGPIPITNEEQETPMEKQQMTPKNQNDEYNFKQILRMDVAETEGPPAVKFNRTRITFNHKAMEKLCPNGNRFVEVHFDEKRKVIGFRRTQTKTSCAFSVHNREMHFPWALPSEIKGIGRRKLLEKSGYFAAIVEWE